MTTALLMVEIQNDYFPQGRIPLENSMEAAIKAQKLLQSCRDKKMLVTHVQHISTRPDAAYLLPCTKGADFHVNVQPLKDELIVKKHYPNSFKDTVLQSHLQKNKINHLIICGMMTHLAIDATVRAAYDLGYTCTVVHDACATRTLDFNQTNISAQNVHHAFLAAFHPTYATLISADDFIVKTSFKQAAVA